MTADGDPEQDYERGGENALPEGEMWREEDDVRVIPLLSLFLEETWFVQHIVPKLIQFVRLILDVCYSNELQMV